MKKITEKQLLILVGIPAIAIFVFIIYSMFFSKSDINEKDIDRNLKMFQA